MAVFTPHDAPAVYGRILDLEQKQARAVREHLLGDPSALPRLQALDNQIAALRAQLS